MEAPPLGTVKQLRRYGKEAAKANTKNTHASIIKNRYLAWHSASTVEAPTLHPSDHAHQRASQENTLGAKDESPKQQEKKQKKRGQENENEKKQRVSNLQLLAKKSHKGG